MADEPRPYQLYWYKAASSLAPMAVLEETGAARGGAGAGTSRHSRRIVFAGGSHRNARLAQRLHEVLGLGRIAERPAHGKEVAPVVAVPQAAHHRSLRAPLHEPRRRCARFRIASGHGQAGGEQRQDHGGRIAQVVQQVDGLVVAPVDELGDAEVPVVLAEGVELLSPVAQLDRALRLPVEDRVARVIDQDAGVVRVEPERSLEMVPRLVGIAVEQAGYGQGGWVRLSLSSNSTALAAKLEASARSDSGFSLQPLIQLRKRASDRSASAAA